jgi:tetratricopeptide (TPR) repeat protein
MPINIEAREKVERNFLSPLFVKLANLHYLNEEYEECIEVCRTGLTIYPDYLTAKLILLKAFLKAEYLNEAESLFQEIRTKITSPLLLAKLRNTIDSLASVSNQEQIYFPASPVIKADFAEFERSINIQEKLFSEHDLESFLHAESEAGGGSLDPDFADFLKLFDSFHFNKHQTSYPPTKKIEPPGRTQGTSEGDALLGKVRIITETLADLYADQGNFKEAFEAYNFLLRAGSPNYKRIEDKINDLERKVIQNDRM